MATYTVIPTDTFDNLQLDAGVLLTTFDPANPAAPASGNIICATTGGITINATPSYSDLGEDVDNCPNNMKELKHLDSWDCSIAFTCLTNSIDGIRRSLGAATVTQNSGKIVPNRDLDQSNFEDIWWVGDLADGGAVAVKLLNALSTEGFSLQTTKNGKGQISVTMTGHVSLSAQTTMPMEIYVIAA